MKTHRFPKTEIVSRIIFLLVTVPPLEWHVGAAVGADAESKLGTQNTIAVWDTGVRSSEPLTPGMLTIKQGWSRISSSGTPSSFKVTLLSATAELPLPYAIKAGLSKCTPSDQKVPLPCCAWSS